MVDVVYAVTDCWIDEATYLRRGQVFWAEDGLVKSRPELFTADPTEFLARPLPARVVEDASAVPGELRRGPGRPRRDGNGPWARTDEGGAA